MTPTDALKKGTRYWYYVSRPLITNDQSGSACKSGDGMLASIIGRP